MPVRYQEGMMDSLITRCPACGTSFKLTGIQLGAAGGAVRCGACLEVFPASEYLINPYPDDMRPEDEPISSAENNENEASTRAETGSIETIDIEDSDTSGIDHYTDEFLEGDGDLEDLQIVTNVVNQVADDSELAGSFADSLHQPLADDYEIETDIEPLDEAARNSLHETIGSEPTEIAGVKRISRNIPKLILLACINLFLIAALPSAAWVVERMASPA